MIKCKCLYDKKSISMYTIGTIVTIGIVYLIIYPLNPIQITFPNIDDNILAFSLSIIGICFAMLPVLVLSVNSVKSFCDDNIPRQHWKLLGLIIPTSIGIVFLVIISSPLQGGYINMNLVGNPTQAQESLNMLSCDDIKHLDDWNYWMYTSQLEKPYIRLLDEENRIDERHIRLIIPDRCLSMIKERP